MIGLLDRLIGLLASGRVVEAIVALTMIEGAGLTWLWRRAGRGVAPAKLWPNLLSGIALLLALYAAQAGAAWPWLGACLLGAGLAHLADMRQRWRSD